MMIRFLRTTQSRSLHSRVMMNVDKSPFHTHANMSLFEAKKRSSRSGPVSRTQPVFASEEKRKFTPKKRTQSKDLRQIASDVIAGKEFEKPSELKSSERSQAKTQLRSNIFASQIKKLRSALLKQNYTEAMDLYEGIFKDQKLHLPFEEYLQLFELIAKKGSFNTCLAVYNRMKKEGLKPTLPVFHAILECCANTKIQPASSQIVKAHKILTDDLKKWNIDRSVFMVNCFFKTVITTLAAINQYPEEFAKTEVNISLLRQYVEDYYKSLHAEDRVDKSKIYIRADKFTYSLAIQFYAKIGDVKKAFEIFDDMKKHFGANVQSFNPKRSLVDGGDMGRKNEDAFIYNTLMNAFLQNKKDLFLIFEIYRQMIEEGNMKPTSHTFSLLLTTTRLIHNSQREYNKMESGADKRHTITLKKFSNEEPKHNDYTDFSTLDEQNLFLLKEFRFSDKVLAIYKELQVHLLNQAVDSQEVERKFGKVLERSTETQQESKIDAYLLNQLAQSLAQANHVDEARSLVFNILKPQFHLITPTTCVMLLRKVISKNCYSLEQFHVHAKPILALLRDNTPAKQKALTTEDLDQIVSVMVKNFKSHAMMLELIDYALEHFKIQLSDNVINNTLPGALRVQVRELYHGSSSSSGNKKQTRQ